MSVVIKPSSDEKNMLKVSEWINIIVCYSWWKKAGTVCQFLTVCGLALNQEKTIDLSLFSFTLSISSFKTSFINFFNTSCENNFYFMLLWIECNDCKQQCIKKLQCVSEILQFCVCVWLFQAICSSSSAVLFLLRAGVCGRRTAAVLCKQVKAVTSL